MAFSSFNGECEVRSATGSDSNGGFWNPLASGTDYSQSDTPVLSLSDVVTNGSGTVTSATGGFTAVMIGNGINIAGTIYEITARASSTSITVSGSPASATGQAGKIGGALATLNYAAAQAPAHCLIYAKGQNDVAGNLNLTAPASLFPGTQSGGNRLVGYGTVRGDGGMFVIKTTASTTYSLTFQNQTWRLSNIEIDANSLASYCVSTPDWTSMEHCKFHHATVSNAKITGQKIKFINCESYSAPYGFSEGGVGQIFDAVDCYVHDCATCGIPLGQSGNVGTAINCIVANCGVGISCEWFGMMKANRIYNCATGIRFTGFMLVNLAQDNVISGCTYAIKQDSDHSFYRPEWDRNAFYNNTYKWWGRTADNSTFREMAATVVGPRSITLAADPFVNAASGDFHVTSTATTALYASGVAGSTFNAPMSWLTSIGSGGGATSVFGSSIISPARRLCA